MSAAELRSSLSRGAAGRLHERQYQMSFYTVLLRHLPAAVNVSPDYGSAVPGCKGYLDFYVDNTVQYGIELLRKGNRLVEHLERFEPAGRYWPIAFKDCVAVDFHEEPSPSIALAAVTAPGRSMKYVRVVFQAGFTSARLFAAGAPEGFLIELQP